MINLLALLYILCGVLLVIYTGGTFALLLIYLFSAAPPSERHPLDDPPTVTVQLPVYNERHVIARLLTAIARLDYPHDKLVVQILDDSTDETTRIAAHHAAELRQRGFCVQYLRRSSRQGYKAGALAYGMHRSATDFYAIFDADFVPPPDFLRRTLPHLLNDPALGMVQGRWGHLNPFANALTAAQTLAIDGHFIIEQTARSRAGLLLSFNGTGGVWRAACIQQAGGWRDTTLTEDFDLSYRAQLGGWRLRVLPDLVVPGELPPHLNAFKQQQSRWARGSTQCLVRTLRPLWRARNITFAQRVMGTLHLCQYMPYPLILLLAVLAPPLMLAGVFGELPLAFLTFSGVVPPLVYAVSQAALYRGWYKRLLAFPALIVFGTGIALSNTLAVLSALGDQEGGTFQRTPKFGAQSAENGSYALHQNTTTYAELVLSAYIGGGAWLALTVAPSAAPYLALSALSYGVVAAWSLVEQWQIDHHQQRARAVGD